MDNLRFTPEVNSLADAEAMADKQEPIKHWFKFNFKKQTILIAAGIILIVAALAVAALFYVKARKMAPQNSATEAQKIITEVGQLIVLPEGEPTVATISDITKLEGQPFFARAQNGFKVLIYSQAKKAILYDPFTKRIVEVAPLNTK